jgi:hypothetical protein
MKGLALGTMTRTGGSVKAFYHRVTLIIMFVSPAPQCQPGTSVHKVHVNCVSHVTLLCLLTHLGCVYNRSM